MLLKFAACITTLAYLCHGGCPQHGRSLRSREDGSTDLSTTEIVSSEMSSTTFDSTGHCLPLPELVYLQDASASMLEIKEAVADGLTDLLDRWQTVYNDTVRFGFASWTDKPIPLRGWGGRAATNWEDYDTCYYFGQPLSTDVANIQQAIKDMPIRLGADLPENPWEALLYAALDPRTNWTESNASTTADGRTITRVILMITDDIGHLPGDGQAGIDIYNGPRTPQSTATGWGAPNALNYATLIRIDGAMNATASNYKEMCRLIGYNDSGILPSSKVERLDELENIFAPAVWTPTQLASHSGLYEEDGCKTMDYPSHGQVAEALKKMNIIPIFLLTCTSESSQKISAEAIQICSEEFGVENAGSSQDTAIQCLVQIYEKQLKEAGIDGLVAPVDQSTDLIGTINLLVQQAADLACSKESDTSTLKTSSTNGGVVAGACVGAVAGTAALGFGAWTAKKQIKEAPITF